VSVVTTAEIPFLSLPALPRGVPVSGRLLRTSPLPSASSVSLLLTSSIAETISVVDSGLMVD